jgi:predicted DNA-binding protein YlxM (UPF0122 family)
MELYKTIKTKGVHFMQNMEQALANTKAYSNASTKNQVQKRKLTLDDVAEIELCYVLGHPITKIAQEFPQVSYTAIRSKIKALKIEPLAHDAVLELAQQYDNKEDLYERLRYEGRKKYYESQLTEAQLMLEALKAPEVC